MDNSEVRSHMMISPESTAKDTTIKQPHTSIQLDESQENNYANEINRSDQHSKVIEEEN